MLMSEDIKKSIFKNIKLPILRSNVYNIKNSYLLKLFLNIEEQKRKEIIDYSEEIKAIPYRIEIEKIIQLRDENIIILADKNKLILFGRHLTQLSAVTKHKLAIKDIILLQDQNILSYCNKRIFIWEYLGNDLKIKCKACDKDTYRISQLKDENILIAKQKELKVLDKDTLTVLKKLNFTIHINAVCVYGLNNILLLTNTKHHYYYNLNDNRLKMIDSFPANIINYLILRDNFIFFILQEYDPNKNNIYVYNIDSQQLSLLKGHNTYVNYIFEKGDNIVTYSLGGEFRFWVVKRRKDFFWIGSINVNIRNVRFMEVIQDGRLVVCLSDYIIFLRIDKDCISEDKIVTFDQELYGIKNLLQLRDYNIVFMSEEYLGVLKYLN
jgi:hypothetical protein